MRPTFSVVTISFNQAQFLRRAIDSVLNQAGVSIEYIVCDPGSKDGSREIIDSYGDRIAARVYERDAGPADGLNRGFERATGDVFCYLNSDDIFMPGAFATVADWMVKHSDVDVATGHALVTDADDKVLRRVWSEPFGRRSAAYGSAVQIQPSTFIRREAFQRSGGFNPSNRISWDWELLVDLYNAGSRIQVIDEFLSCYRLHTTSITNSGSGSDLRGAAEDRVFLKLMGRERRPHDAVIGQALRSFKHLRRPIPAIERASKGPIFERGA